MENKVNNRFTIEYALIHILFQALAGIVYGFTVYYLIERGYSASMAGLCLSITNFIGFVFQPIISNFLDRSRKISVFEVTSLICIAMSIVYLFNFFVLDGSIFIFIIQIIFISLYQLIEPLLNSICNLLHLNGIEIEFGVVRALGSFSYGVICVAFGFLTNLYSYFSVIIGGFVFSIILTLIFIFLRNDYSHLQKVSSTTIDKGRLVSFSKFLKDHKYYVFVCLFLVGILFGYLSIDNFMYLVVENVGGDSSDLGLILGIKALFETFGMILFAKLVKKIDIVKLLSISAVGFIIKIASVTFSNSIFLIYLSQIAQTISFAFVFPGMVEYANKTMKKSESIRGQALFSMSICLGSVISSSICGVVSDNFGVSAMCKLSLIVTALSSVGFIYYLIKDSKKHHEQAQRIY